MSLKASVLCGVPFVATYWYSYDHDGTLVLSGLFLFVMLAMTVIGGLLGVTALVKCAFADRLDRPTLLRSSVALALPGLLTIGTWVGVNDLAWRFRRSEFEALAERAQPLIEAIGRYEQDHGRPPPVLEDLVPDYSPVVPKTGHARYRLFEYESFDPGDEQATWELRVPCSLGFLNWDEFFYWPSEEYPERTGSGSIERIGRWAYLHE